MTHRPLRTHEISELEGGVYSTLLEPCSVAVLPYVLAPEASYVWMVEHAPDPRLQWGQLPVPIAPGAAAEPFRVRSLSFDLQMPAAEFLDRIVPRLPGDTGILLLQLAQPVPDSLRYRDVIARPAWPTILRQNGWMLTFDLPHEGEYAAVTAPDRHTLERFLAEPVMTAGKMAGELP